MKIVENKLKVDLYLGGDTTGADLVGLVDQYGLERFVVTNDPNDADVLVFTHPLD